MSHIIYLKTYLDRVVELVSVLKKSHSKFELKQTVMVQNNNGIGIVDLKASR